MSQKKIGILGGTFNPIHNGHLLLADAALNQLALDEIWFLPSGQPYMKNQSEIVSKEHRYNMVCEAIKNNSKYKISDIEIEKKGNSYTYETLEELKFLYPDYIFYFILGADCIFNIENWKEPQKIFQSCILVSAVRDGVSKIELKKQCDLLINKYGAHIFLLNFKEIEISSTTIRKEIMENASFENYLPKEVADYIIKNYLYK